MMLLITPSGTVAYVRDHGNRKTSADAPLKAFAGNGVVVRRGPTSSTFKVCVPPHQADGQCKMTVDGLQPTRKP